jgi:hypothetical protein
VYCITVSQLLNLVVCVIKLFLSSPSAHWELPVSPALPVSLSPCLPGSLPTTYLYSSSSLHGRRLLHLRPWLRTRVTVLCEGFGQNAEERWQRHGASASASTISTASALQRRYMPSCLCVLCLPSLPACQLRIPWDTKSSKVDCTSTQFNR